MPCRTNHGEEPWFNQRANSLKLVPQNLVLFKKYAPNRFTIFRERVAISFAMSSVAIGPVTDEASGKKAIKHLGLAVHTDSKNLIEELVPSMVLLLDKTFVEIRAKRSCMAAEKNDYDGDSVPLNKSEF